MLVLIFSASGAFGSSLRYFSNSSAASVFLWVLSQKGSVGEASTGIAQNKASPNNQLKLVNPVKD
jgi:hypothetical protein